MSWVVSVVEDDDDIREDLARVLKARGLQVLEARHGAAVLDEIRRRGVRPSLLLLDLMMPVMDGWALLNAQATEPLLDGVPVVVMTARDPAGPLPSTVHAVLQKPFSLTELLDAVQSICGNPR
jgi:CheY-like chemotaxis protein